MRLLGLWLIGMIGCVETFPTVSAPVDAGPDACAPVIEQCNGDDDDCDGRVDEGLLPRPCPGLQGVCRGAESVCVDAEWTACDGAAQGGDTWTADEDLGWCDTLDNDCDGMTDEGCLCVDGATQPCGSDIGPCEAGEQVCARGQWGECVGGITPEPETCNESDDDCDEIVDEGVLNACGVCGEVPEEICDGDDNDCDGTADEGVLNACGECGEVPVEVCNGLDEDCDGMPDEGLLNACGECGEVPAEACGDAIDNDCDGTVDEGVPERCNGVDDNCDGIVDNIPLLACNSGREVPCERGFTLCIDGARTCRSTCDPDD